MLTTWSAGVAGGAALIAAWRVVGPGFLWLAAGVGLLLGGAAWAAGGGVPAAIATIALVVAAALARRPRAAATALGVACLGFLIQSAVLSTWPLAVTGAVALGGVTDEMLLGHWYLVDPRLPRRPLRRLALMALTGIVADAALLTVHADLPWSPAEAGFGWAFVVLSVLSAALMLAVWLALKEPAYSAVMAATGLSYLAVLTVIGAGVTGRSLVADVFVVLATGRLTWL
ncbi:MAG: hypothetical protein ACXW1Y_13255 [Acidimicrobiia bacterium]